jgi:putative DNA primase/helicase
MKIAERTGNDVAKKWVKQRTGYAVAQRLMRELLAFPELDIKRSAFDRSEYLLGVKNGVVDLRTSEFRAGKASDMISITTNIEYSSKADFPEFRKFLKSVMPTIEYRNYFRTVCGYFLVGKASEQLAFFF